MIYSRDWNLNGMTIPCDEFFMCIHPPDMVYGTGAKWNAMVTNIALF
jgi:hypothetical protein